jgi:hypothetical protein
LQPLISHKHIPRTEQDYAIFASAEPYLMTAFIIIASRLDSKPSAKRIHAQTWALMKVRGQLPICVFVKH